MFRIDDVIVYGSQGICKVEKIETKQIGKQTADYYVLKPLFKENTAVFVPMQNEALTSKMQNVLTKAQAEELIRKITLIYVIKPSDEAEKRELYKAVLSSGDREKLIALIKTIRSERDERRESGKKLNINDEQTLTKAEQLLYNELAFVLGCEPDEVKNIIKF
ncbi:MAG: hypothetical protein IJZ21_02955 [Clostridia bacterium]|nr:hypothetical protein [Clostridia bacterium]